MKYKLDTSLLETVEKMGSAVPMIIVDVEKHNAYYICLNDYIEKVMIPSKPRYFEQKTILINVPTENKLTIENGEGIFEWYAKRGKFFSFFNKVAYQYHELQCHGGDKDLAVHFANILHRLDVWSADIIPADIKEEFCFFHEYKYPRDLQKVLSHLENAGKDIYAKIWDFECIEEVSLYEVQNRTLIILLWQRMAIIGRSFEDVSKEVGLPTSLNYNLTHL